MEKPLRIILITGMPGSGKEEVIKTCRKKGMKIVRMGDFVREEASARGIELTDENVGNVAQEMREKHGFDIWAKRTIEAIDDQFTVVDGVRGRAEVLLFKKHFGNEAAVVAVHSSPKTRFRRLMGRKRDDAPKTIEEFENRELRELHWGLGDVIARAEYLILNESTLEALEKRVNALCERIGGKKPA